MTIGSRGLGRSMLRGAGLCLLLVLGACTRDHKLDLFGWVRSPAVARQGQPAGPPPAAAAATPAADDEPVPVAAPRAPVETEGVAAPPSMRSGKKS
jgi:hypothetical protein